MLPKKIVMENFGPFIHEEVNFDHFLETPLFLISGKTGAGKTTIFDAITFALFGDASGGVRNANEIRSTFADATEETRVRFFFEHQGRQFVIERSPKQVVQKKSGKGETTKNQKVQLIVLDNEAKEVEAYQKVEPVSDMIYRMLHLNKDQFRQIAMLPQGEFRTFLVANSSEKEAVLRSLFGTAIYRTFTENLKIKKQELEKEVSEIIVRIDQLLQQVVTNEGATYQESMINAKNYLTREKHALQEMQKTVLVKKTAYTEQQELLVKAEQLVIKFQQFEEAQKEVSLYQAQEDEMSVKRGQAEKGKKIQQLLPLYTRIKELEKSSQQLEIQTSQIQEALASLAERQQKWQEQAEKFESEQSDWSLKESTCQEWKNALPFVIQKEELEAQKQELLLLQKGLQQECDRIVALSGELQDQLTILKKRQSAEEFFHDRRFQEVQFQQQVDQLLKEQRHLNQEEELIEEQQIQLAVLTDKISQFSNELTARIAENKKQKSRWASFEIARLSQDLLPGEPCPVCGSLQHPKPANKESISSNELMKLQVALEEVEECVKRLQIQKETAENEFRTNSKKYETAHQKHKEQTESFQQEIAKFAEKVQLYYNEANGHQLEEIQDYLKEKQKETAQELAEIAAAKQEITKLETQQHQLKMEHDKASEELRQADSQLQLLSGRLQTAAEQAQEWKAAELEQQIKTLEDEISARQQLIRAHQEERQLINTENTRLMESQKQVMNQTDSLKNEQEQKSVDYFEVLKKSGVDQASVEKHYQEPQDFYELEEEIKVFENGYLLAKDRFQQLEKAIADQTYPDLNPLKERVIKSEEIFQAAQEAFYQKEIQLQQMEEILQQIQELHQMSSSQLDELNELTELYRTMNGDNPAKISLERFVLQWYLNEVLQAGNQQLAVLTNGRYQFELNQQIGRSKGNTGLEINIYDDNTGASRSAHTLSGGESFIAALALALGLAEVIQSQSGGIAMETLFIDEGFGSLDEEALEMAVSALEGIESQGRMIGIISHVRELKERIPQQVIVQTSGTGQSTIRYQLEGWERH
ncbi:AAA family ATPase [Candidatus Enterococcus ferrettii]|uniref:Nuclease SbcCD subunit C n=1 Tax=Candidatus Enterococcus ferrettii TaxID=2815324 RepID=A0ABV0EWU1_9ENTE|nr:SMC family ATPase [Enterococcus sp. 665A]MBO1338782.1 SMC family ATPase [Enterococcus sp. 665A]